MSKKKVLIIAYYWPPAGGPGVQRWLKFATYLPAFDIEPIVYVPDNAHYPIVDEALCAEVPQSLTVIKRPIVEPYSWASLLSRKKTKNISAGIIPEASKQSFLQKAMLYVRGNFFVPDARVLWVKPSIKFLKNYLNIQKIDTVITTGPPHSMHLIGLELKKTLDIRWIADFRDPWTTIGYHDKLKMSSRTKRRHKRLEKAVLNSADSIIVTSPGTKRNFQKISSKPIEVITNGFDKRTDITSEQTSKFCISHIGSLLSERNPINLWKALATLSRENEAFKKSFTLQLIGKVSQDVIDSIRECGLGQHLDIKGYLPHIEAQQLQHQASLLLLIEIDAEITREIIPGKLFEYLAAEKPILAIGPEKADMKYILEETGHGQYFTYDQYDQIKAYVTNAFEDFQNGVNAHLEAPQQYHRKSLAEHLARVLKKN